MIVDEVMTVEEVAGLLAELRSDRLLSVEQVAERLGVKPDEVRRWARQGLLPSEKVGRTLVFRLAHLTEWEIDGRLRVEALQAATTEEAP